jgi:hypothetical protein
MSIMIRAQLQKTPPSTARNTTGKRHVLFRLRWRQLAMLALGLAFLGAKSYTALSIFF